MIPAPFEYHRPRSVDEAVALLGKFGEDARVLAGGHSLIPLMKLRLAPLSHLIDLQEVDALAGIDLAGGSVTIGAMTRMADLLASTDLADHCPIIGEAAFQIADPQVRNMGTLGGNVANGDPGNDMPAIMQALDATYLVQGPNGAREIAARSFYESAYVTALAEGEIVTAIRFSVPPEGHGAAYEKQKRKIGDYATAAAAVVMTMKNGRCESASIALTNLGDTPLYVEEAGAALAGSELDEGSIGRAAAAAEAIARPSSDGRGPAEFRTKLAGVMVRRAIARAAERVS